MTVIGISGSYGGLNVGDEAILASALAQLRDAVPGVELVVFSRDAAHTRAHLPADRVVPTRGLSRDEVLPEIVRLDLFLLGGGGLLYDGEAYAYLRDVRLAQSVGVPTMAYAIGAGPLTRPDERRLVRDALRGMARITVREPQAKRLLEEVGVDEEVIVTADPALLLTPEPFTSEMLRREGVPEGRHLVGMSVREPGWAAPNLGETYHELVANAADFIAERFDADVLFVPMERDDIRHAHRVIAQMSAPHRGYVLKRTYPPRQVLGLMEHLDFAVGMRLHFLIFAALSCVPVIALPYAPKVAGFLEKLRLPARVPVHEDRPGPLLAQIDHLWDRRGEAREMLRSRLPELQAHARRTTALAVEVLADRPHRDVAAIRPAG